MLTILVTLDLILTLILIGMAVQYLTVQKKKLLESESKLQEKSLLYKTLQSYCDEYMEPKRRKP